MIKLAIGLFMIFVFSCSKSTALPIAPSSNFDSEFIDYLETNYNQHYKYIELADQGSGFVGSYYLIYSEINGVRAIIPVNEDSVNLDTCIIYRKY